MSTVATQLNWGSSYLVEDFYRRFLKKNGSEAHYVNVSRLATVFLVIAAALVALQLGSVVELPVHETSANGCTARNSANDCTL